MKNVANYTSFFFIMAVYLLTAISILSVWDIFGSDVVEKAIETTGVLAFATIVAIISSRHFNKNDSGVKTETDLAFISMFTGIRKVTTAILFLGVTILAFIGILSIWDVLSGNVISKSLSSMFILVFASIIIVITAKEMEDKSVSNPKTEVVNLKITKNE